MDIKDLLYAEKQIGTDYSSIEEVRVYDEKMGTLRDIKGENDQIVKALEIKPDHSIIEFGAGTANSAIHIAKLCKNVVAVDISDMMLKYSKNKTAKLNVNNIEFVNAGFLTYENYFDDFDSAFSQLALHHLPDFWKMYALKKINSLLKPGGKFFLRDVVYPADIEDYDNFLSSLVNDIVLAAGEKAGKDAAMHVKDEFSTIDSVMDLLIEKSGFTIQEKSTSADYIYSYTCVKRD